MGRSPQVPVNPINTDRNCIVDKCECCGFISYSVIGTCPVCGNSILAGKIIDKSDWFKGRVKEILNERKKNGKKHNSSNR